MAGQPASNELSYARSPGKGIPLAEDGLCEPVGRVRDDLGGKANGVPGSGNPVRLAVYEVVAEPTGKRGQVSPLKTPEAALSGSRSGGDRRPGRGRDVGSSESAGRAGDPVAATSTVDGYANC